jgi:hypothetical protein
MEGGEVGIDGEGKLALVSDWLVDDAQKLLHCRAFKLQERRPLSV